MLHGTCHTHMAHRKTIRIHNSKKIIENYHILCIIVITMIVSLLRREFRSSSILGKLSMGYILCHLVQSMSLFASLPTFQHSWYFYWVFREFQRHNAFSKASMQSSSDWVEPPTLQCLRQLTNICFPGKISCPKWFPISVLQRISWRIPTSRQTFKHVPVKTTLYLVLLYGIYWVSCCFPWIFHRLQESKLIGFWCWCL